MRDRSLFTNRWGKGKGTGKKLIKPMASRECAPSVRKTRKKYIPTPPPLILLQSSHPYFATQKYDIIKKCL